MDITDYPILLYVSTLSVVTLCVFGIDKLKARARWRRIPEKTLLFLCMLGGTPGGAIGMMLFRHKISKPSFLKGFFAVLALQLGLMLAWLYFTAKL